MGASVKIKQGFREVNVFLKKHLYLSLSLEATGMTMLIELISRKSVPGLFQFIFSSPMTFLVNVGIIFFTLSLSMLVPRRGRFVKDAVLIAWTILGIVNGVVLRYRMTPFSAEDFNMIPSLFRIMKNYLTTGSIALIVIALIGVAVLLVVLWRKTPREKLPVKWIVLAGRTGLIAFSCFILLNMSMQAQAISTDFMNLADAYEEYGFAYCFSTSLVDVGIDKPDDYSAKLMTDIVAGIKQDEEDGQAQSLFTAEGDTLAQLSDEETVDDVNTTSGDEVQTVADAQSVSAGFDSIDMVETTTEESETDATDQVRPNIIMIQLESFFDPDYLTAYTYSQDPIPNFRSIKENFTSGYLTVPVVGAGTSNTEFEILTGMSTSFFGAGEYPYNTVLKTTVTEAIPQILRQYGYTSTAIHNNTGTFYNRHIVFSNMGFDRFIPEEYMYDTQVTPNNWVKDNILTDILLDVLDESEGSDFIYTITVQSHGRYPSEQVLEDPLITVSCEDENVNVNPVEYYANMIYEVDQMIGELTTVLSQRDEPVVLVMFGDHLPALGFSEEDVSLPSLYNTEYVIWNNMGLELEDRDMNAESLGTGVLQLFDLDNGIIPQFHEVYDGTEEYSDYLEAIEYDIFYGEGYVYRSFAGIEEEEETETDGAQAESQTEAWSLYQASDLQFGYLPITVSSYQVEEDGLYVYGDNFNASSQVVLGEKVLTTEYVDRQTLVVRDIPKQSESLSVGQFDEQLQQLGENTNAIAYEYASE